MKVSLLTPTRNRRHFLPRALASVLAQTHADWELLVHDVSDEPVRDLVPHDPRILYSRGEPRGPALDFQACLDMATGDLVHPFADDDRLVPHALETAVREIGEHEWLVARTVIETEDGQVVCHRGGDWQSVEATVAGSYMLGGAIYWRPSLSDRVGGFDAAFDGAADFDLYARFARTAEPRVIPDVLYRYTDHAGTDSRVRADNQQQQSALIRERLRA